MRKITLADVEQTFKGISAEDALTIVELDHGMRIGELLTGGLGAPGLETGGDPALQEAALWVSHMGAFVAGALTMQRLLETESRRANGGGS